jgi:hypothetical protein
MQYDPLHIEKPDFSPSPAKSSRCSGVLSGRVTKKLRVRLAVEYVFWELRCRPLGDFWRSSKIFRLGSIEPGLFPRPDFPVQGNKFRSQSGLRQAGKLFISLGYFRFHPGHAIGRVTGGN